MRAGITTIDLDLAIAILVGFAAIDIWLGARLLKSRRGGTPARPAPTPDATHRGSVAGRPEPASTGAPASKSEPRVADAAPVARIASAAAAPPPSVARPSAGTATGGPAAGPPSGAAASTVPASSGARVSATGPMTIGGMTTIGPLPAAPSDPARPTLRAPAATDVRTPTTASAAARPAGRASPAAGPGRWQRLFGAGFIAVGVVAGFLVVAVIIARPGGTGGVLGASASPATGAGASVPVVTPSPTPRAPSAAVSALKLTVAVDDRLAASAAMLRPGAPGASDPVAIAAVLRSIAADSAWGLDVVGRLGEWPAAAGLQAQLRDHYTAVAAAARDGLGATITSAAAYRAAAKRMLALTDQLPALRAATVELATANGIALPSP